jgi:hypothetical protein
MIVIVMKINPCNDNVSIINEALNENIRTYVPATLHIQNGILINNKKNQYTNVFPLRFTKTII